LEAIISFEDLFTRKINHIHVAGEGEVSAILNDDLDGKKHQRFILSLDEHKTLLIINNIDEFPRVEPLNIGDKVEFSGEYVWNRHGGMIHWTHEDPHNLHEAGYVRVSAKKSEAGDPEISFPLGRYRHYKGNFYELTGFAVHSETLEHMVIYKALYGEGRTWVRPQTMWDEWVEKDGERVRRFEFIGNAGGETLILASASPRRRELMGLTGYSYEVKTAAADETISPGVGYAEAVKRNAARKARAVAKTNPGRTVIGADTIVVIDKTLLGKPRDARDAIRMLKLLSGRKHYVYTGVCILKNKRKVTFYEKTTVQFRELSDDEIASYVETGEPLDKAGAYGIQQLGAALVKGVNGDYFNVVGLPVARLTSELKKFTEKPDGC